MIAVRGLRFAYPGADAEALSGVTLEIDAGRMVGLMGHNGAGKTTLLKLIVGLLEPDAGGVRVGGDDDAVVGFAPENPALALFAETVREEVAFFPRNLGLDVEGPTREAMEAMDVADFAGRVPHSLSAGEQRRVSIASVLSGDPAVLALDDPTAGLDRTAGRDLGTLIRGLDATVVFTTHDADFAYEFADEVVVMSGGEVVRRGEPRKVLADDALLEETGIRPPGIVSWARGRSLARLPADIEEAAAMADGT